MIITRLRGGLGNQMFQYAAGRRLAYTQNTVLKLDTTAFIDTSLRKFELSSLNIKASIARADEIQTFTKNGIPSFLPFLPARLYANRNIIRERQFHFDSDIMRLRDNVYLDGYWQSEKYFTDIQELIKSDFTFCKLPSASDTDLIQQIQSCNSISLHIRRGDYVTNLHTHDFHGVCTLDYYYTCINRLSEQIEHPHFFVFSDDPNWAETHLKVDHPLTIIAHNSPENAVNDLRLMSMCKHNIIANSSFSWWGAWLNQNPDRIVCAPNKWFANAPLDTKDLLPESWIRL